VFIKKLSHKNNTIKLFISRVLTSLSKKFININSLLRVIYQKSTTKYLLQVLRIFFQATLTLLHNLFCLLLKLF